MKATLLIVALSAALGAAAGRLIPAREPEPAPREEASAPIPAETALPEPVDESAPETAGAANTAAEKKALEAEIAALSEDPRTWNAEQLQLRKDELLKQLEKLRRRNDPMAVLDIAQQLARLGPVAWPEALKALTGEMDLLRNMGADRFDVFIDACDGAVLDVMRWALTEPTLKDSEDARLLAALALTRHFDQDERIPGLLLRALSTEGSADIAELLAGAIPRMFQDAVIPDLAPALPVDPRDAPGALLAWFRGLRLSDWTAAEKSHVLASLAGHSSPVIREAAAAAQALLSASGTGFALEWVAPSAAATLGDLRPGDVVRSVEGEVPGSSDHLLEILSRVRVGESVILTVWREGQEFALGWSGRAEVKARIRGFALQPE
ncbi:MAG: hypothetical protein FD180_868 [Planctomycetota bacterium]|nr:MAG: hypothetical protein FD180_868 [Planctomycetota bacterium]